MGEHNHDHHHDHTQGANKKALTISLILIASFMIVEVIGGVLTNSLALLSDAGHMLSDAVSLAVALAAFKMGEKAADSARTFGYRRFEILAAVFNGVTLIVIAVFIVAEAAGRFVNPPEIATTGMLVIAVLGLVVNIIVAKILMSGDTHDNLNMKGALLHVFGDLLGSVAAIVAALSIMFFGWGFMDPLASVIVAVLIAVSGFRILRQSLNVLMEGVPENIDVDTVINTINNIEGVEDAHHLHVWSISSGMNALSVHIVVNGTLNVHETQKIIHRIEEQMKHENIEHVTVQVECKHHDHDDELLCN
ncbi:cation diffusion facilitator family transporter [Jeotgalicoccus psychrophilus]|uniref:cation diffusion facilitator family transporter n=1 Tax=Jeotgalicoccus psychrophilus TaxID=157228 RepID=UPI0004113291|nr:cation diffusion facilitator family transporter [Jeotgalicoccus psychrophilus]